MIALRTVLSLLFRAAVATDSPRKRERRGNLVSVAAARASWKQGGEAATEA